MNLVDDVDWGSVVLLFWIDETDESSEVAKTRPNERDCVRRPSLGMI